MIHYLNFRDIHVKDGHDSGFMKTQLFFYFYSNNKGNSSGMGRFNADNYKK